MYKRQQIELLASGVPIHKTSSAIKEFESAGLDGFPALTAHLDNPVRAAQHFVSEGLARDSNGNPIPYKPSIGTACFELLQGQIEGVWPKGYRSYQVLNPSNIREWLAMRKDKSLQELRLECATNSLNTARRDNNKNPSDWTRRCVKFFAENLLEIQGKD